MAGLSEKAKARIIEEEKVRQDARLKVIFSKRSFFGLLIGVAVLAAAVFLISKFNGSPERQSTSLISLSNEIQANINSLTYVLESDTQAGAQKSRIRTFVPASITQEFSYASFNWIARDCSVISAQDRFGLFNAGTRVRQINEMVEQYAKASPQVAQAVWIAAIAKEKAAIEKYMSAAKKVEDAIDEALKGKQGLEKYRVKVSSNER